ncbi:GNAT family N-acetyltransferase [Sphingomonas sp. Leaf17]|uniref:GNAT family N-acetyltransferase n=1 Tax=Sphingomonas sp. Leaf17 TaxID=1735683 RepID=UPI001F1A26C0|nr:GNAT family N-acetyltransferase [Sphingomonas sp. Leaf17]
MIRTAVVRDIAEVDAIMAAAFDPRFGEAWTRSQCVGILAMPGVSLMLAETDDGPAGFALVRRILDEAELLLLAVAPPHRGKGIGAALLRAVINDCRMMDTAMLHLEVRSGNPAVRLYGSHGFVQVGHRRGYYRSRDGLAFDALTYRLMLR